MQNTSTAELFMSEASIHNDVITGINYLTACYSWSHWAPRSHKMPVEWLMLLKMDAHLLHRVVCEHVLNLMFLFVGIRWRQLCWWDPEGMCLLIYVLLKTNSSTFSADCLESVKEHLALLTPVQVNWTFFPRVFSSPSFRKWLRRGPLRWQPSTPPAKLSHPSFHSPRRSAPPCVGYSNDYVSWWIN